MYSQFMMHGQKNIRFQELLLVITTALWIEQFCDH